MWVESNAAFERLADAITIEGLSLAIPIAAQRENIRHLYAMLSDSELAAISSNRDFAESERYIAKEEVDNALVESPVVSNARGRIERLFGIGDIAREVEAYQRALQSDMAALHRLMWRQLNYSASATLKEWKRFWRDATDVADVDNAHAMYLSSGNWSFSVFNGCVAALEQYAGDDTESLASLLSAGIQDPRTATLTMFSDSYRGLDRMSFVRALRRGCDWIRPSGVVPLVAFRAATDASMSAIPLPSATSVSERYLLARTRVCARLPDHDREQFLQVCASYRALHACRVDYDTYEYFGFYALVRHALIIRTADVIRARNGEIADAFHRAASMYQFHRAAKILSQL